MLGFDYEELERATYSQDEQAFVRLLMDNSLLKNELRCNACSNYMDLVKYTHNIDHLSWRCMQSSCDSYKKYVSVRTGIFFENFSKDLRVLFRILLKFSRKETKKTICSSISSASNKLVERFLLALNAKIPETDFSDRKLGGPGKIVQIDETILNFKCKNYRGQSAGNRTDAISIVEVGDQGIERVFAKVIPDKRKVTLIPIIIGQVVPHSLIRTDEHGSYRDLNRHDFVHETVCHKYEFVNRESGVHTQHVESFNNIFK